MKKFVSLIATSLVVLSACSSGGSAQPTESASVQRTDCDKLATQISPNEIASESNALPNITVDCLDGSEKVDLAKLRGPLLIAVWASWCVPCSEEMPIMDAFHMKHSDTIDVLGYALMDSDQAVQALENWGVAITSVQDQDGVFRADLGISAPPTTLFVNENGSIVYRHFGALTSVEQIESLVTQHLQVTM